MEVDVGDARELPLAGRDLDALMTRLALPKTEKERPQRKAFPETLSQPSPTLNHLQKGERDF
jgi:hypothetical protein